MSAEKDYKDREKRREWRRNYCRSYMRKYRQTLKLNGVARTWNSPGYVRNLRQKTFQLLGGAICSGCGCDIYEILEINHKNGGGHKEHREKTMAQMYRDILSGKSNKNDYNILCRVCNSLHYVKDILKIGGHSVEWIKPS